MNYAVNKVLERDKNGRPIPKEIIDDELNREFSDLTITTLPEVHEKPETKSAVEIKNALIHPLPKDSPDNRQITENSIKNQLMNGNGCENQLSYGISNTNKPMNGNSNGNQLMTDSHKTANGWSDDHLATGDRVRNDADFFIGFSTTPGMSLFDITQKFLENRCGRWDYTPALIPLATLTATSYFESMLFAQVFCKITL